LKRAIQKYLEDPLAEEIIKGTMTEGDTLEIIFDKESNILTINVLKVPVQLPPKTPKKKKEEKKDE
jgi:ATP-dependent Clp protease ATP-binding subunit ClpC